MKKRIPSCILVCFLAAICLFSQCVGFFITHGDVTYRLWTSIRPHDDLAWHEVVPSGLRAYTMEELKADASVQFSTVMMLVNSRHPLPDGYEAILREYNGARMYPDMVEPYIAMRDEVQRKTGMRIYVSSDYRTREEQMEILAESGSDVAAQVGCSEHEAGLALDVYAPYFGGESFLQSRAGRLVNEICSSYGYIVRYPLGKEEVTGISYEPWHLRYVGAPHAELMTESGLALEEYIEVLRPGTWYEAGEYLISRQHPDRIFLPDAYKMCQISPDGTGYVIITLKNI